MTSLLGNLAVGHDVTRLQPPQDRDDIALERHGVDPAPATGYAGVMSDVPENDALEQATDIEDLPEPEAPHLGREVPEADALEQAEEVLAGDEDYVD
jgi:hypothetical protein